jgi:hypothetical protein
MSAACCSTALFELLDDARCRDGVSGQPAKQVEAQRLRRQQVVVDAWLAEELSGRLHHLGVDDVADDGGEEFASDVSIAFPCEVSLLTLPEPRRSWLTRRA